MIQKVSRHIPAPPLRPPPLWCGGQNGRAGMRSSPCPAGRRRRGKKGRKSRTRTGLGLRLDRVLLFIGEWRFRRRPIPQNERNQGSSKGIPPGLMTHDIVMLLPIRTVVPSPGFLRIFGACFLQPGFVIVDDVTVVIHVRHNAHLLRSKISVLRGTKIRICPNNAVRSDWRINPPHSHCVHPEFPQFSPLVRPRCTPQAGQHSSIRRYGP